VTIAFGGKSLIICYYYKFSQKANYGKHTLGGCAAWNRGADFVQHLEHLAPSLRAGTRSWTGHREPHNQTAFACTAHGAGQHRDYLY